MQTDVSKITLTEDVVSVPLGVWREIVAFCRWHGETDLPLFLDTKGYKGYMRLDKIPTSGSIWPGNPMTFCAGEEDDGA